MFVRIFEHNGDVLSKDYKYLVEVLCSKLKVLGIAVLWYKIPRSLVDIYQLFEESSCLPRLT
jgi:diphthamide synthase (EF-2-diphthine--ammonia ligase)